MLLTTTVREMNSAVVLITGIALVASAVNSMLEYSASYAATRNTPGETKEIDRQ